MNEYEKKLQEYNELIVRIASVSREDILTQLQEEYEQIEQEMKALEEKKRQEDKEYLRGVLDAIKIDYIKFYGDNFIELEAKDIVGSTDYKKHRFRTPNNTMQLVMILNYFKIKVVILDCEGYPIDELGKYEDLCVSVYSNGSRRASILYSKFLRPVF